MGQWLRVSFSYRASGVRIARNEVTQKASPSSEQSNKPASWLSWPACYFDGLYSAIMTDASVSFRQIARRSAQAKFNLRDEAGQ